VLIVACDRRAADASDAWPVVTSLPFLLPKSSTVDCEKSRALVNWFYWIQTSSQASKLASRLVFILILTQPCILCH
jgi:hypothetical protein